MTLKTAPCPTCGKFSGYHAPSCGMPPDAEWSRYKWDAENRPVEDPDAAPKYRIVTPHQPRQKPAAVPFKPTLSAREITIERDHGICYYCGQTPDDITVDHKTPRARGGKNHPGNLVACCLRCNGAKGNMTLDEFTEWIVDVYVHFIEYGPVDV